LELAVLDMDTKGKPTDDKIADKWGLSSARQVREVRATEEYRLVLTELQSMSIRYAGDRIGKIAARALEHLESLLPDLVDAAHALLQRQPIAGGGYVPLDSRSVSTANSIVRTLMELSAIKSLADAEITEDKRPQVLPNLRLARSETAVLKEYRAEMERGEVVDADFKIQTPAQESTEDIVEST